MSKRKRPNIQSSDPNQVAAALRGDPEKRRRADPLAEFRSGVACAETLLRIDNGDLRAASSQMHVLAALVHLRCAWEETGDAAEKHDLARAAGVIVQRFGDPKLAAAAIVSTMDEALARRFIGAIATEANLSPDNQELFYAAALPPEAPW